MVQSRGSKTGYPARWVTRFCPKAHNNEYHPGRRTMQSDGQINDSPATVGNGNVFHGCGKPPELNGTKYPFVVLSTCTSRWLTCLGQSRKCGAWGTPHPALSIVHCVSFAMATPSFPRVPTPSSPPFTSPRVWVSFSATYSLGASLFGPRLILRSQPHAVMFCGARLFPRKRPSWIIEWRRTTAGSPHRTNNSQVFPRLQHQRRGTRPSLVATTATRRMQCTGRVPSSRYTT